MAPGVHSPVAVAIIDGFYWRAVRIGKVFVEICCTAQSFESRRVLGVFPVERYLRKGDVVGPLRLCSPQYPSGACSSAAKRCRIRAPRFSQSLFPNTRPESNIRAAHEAKWFGEVPI